ncbi:MAG: hypothetical protein M1481_03595 [Candidatus Thermoplasmatota archaeon]|nr:hypothetical protein [Candidatus Thermoplasmatota archaeon]MCL5963718.1 hypothetical protein [Candidatus Thermoplasmatota archaeon]
MKILFTTWFGTFVIENNNVIDKILFKKDESIILKKMISIKNGEILNEERSFIEKYRDLYCYERRLQRYSTFMNTEKIPNLKSESFGCKRSMKKTIFMKYCEYLLNESEQDVSMIEAVKTLNTIDEMLNLITERHYNWKTRLYNFNEPKELLPELRALDDFIKEVTIYRDKLENFIKDEATKIAPNSSTVLGPMIAAKLIAHAGGINRISKLSAGAVQIMGAEKAYFKAKKRDGKKGPKHGLIFLHPAIHTSELKKRGKISRIFACKAIIALRVDASNGTFIGDKLKNEINDKIEKILKS